MSNYEQAVAREERNRLLALLHCGPPLLGLPVVALTWRHVVELIIAENAFFTSREAKPGDIFQFLWRLNPSFRRPDGTTPNFDAAMLPYGARRPSRLQSAFHRAVCYMQAFRVPAPVAEREIHLRLLEAFQDRPSYGEGGQEYVSPLKACPNWLDFMGQSMFAMGGLQCEEMLNTRVAWTFQMLRTEAVKEGRGEHFIPPSAALKRFDGA